MALIYMRTILKDLLEEERILTPHSEQPIGTKMSEAYFHLNANIIQSCQNMMLYFLLVQH
jgi:hypothetical protein